MTKAKMQNNAAGAAAEVRPAVPQCAMPTLAEIPPATVGCGRNVEDLIRLTLIPHDDTDVRATAIKLFLTEERTNNTAGGGNLDEPKGIRLDLSCTPARTPGGIAWKIAEVLTVFSDDDDWAWWRYLLQSAMMDAIEMERARQAQEKGT